jgi:hypothetical protein
MKFSILPVFLLCLCLHVGAEARVGPSSQPQVREFSASAQDSRGAVHAEGTLRLPATPSPVRGVVAVIRWGAGERVYQDPALRQLADELRFGLLLLGVDNDGGIAEGPDPAQQAVRNAAVGGAEALLELLKQLAEQTGRSEIGNAKLLFWGHSAAGSFGTTFAAMHPTRTIAFVRYHSHTRGLPVDLAITSRIPALIFAGENDATAGVEDSEDLWRSGRTLRAPWTYALEPGAAHSSLPALARANELTIPWIRAVSRQRLPTEGMDMSSIDDASGWLVGNATGEAAPSGSFDGPRVDASWLPDLPSAEGWRLVTGTPTR